MTIDSRLENVSLLGLAVRGICRHLSMNPAGCYEMELCVVESVNNVIKHAYGSEPGHQVEAILHLYENCLIFQLRDIGRSAPTSLLPSFDVDLLTPDLLPERGLGLFIIHYLMDMVHYESTGEGNRLTLVKYFAGRGSYSEQG